MPHQEHHRCCQLDLGGREVSLSLSMKFWWDVGPLCLAVFAHVRGLLCLAGFAHARGLASAGAFQPPQLLCLWGHVSQ